MKRKQFNDLLVQTLLDNKEFLHNNFEVIRGVLYWRDGTLTGKNLGACAGKPAGKGGDIVYVRGIHIPVSAIISALEF